MASKDWLLIGVGNDLRRHPERDLGDVALIDIDLDAHVVGIGELRDIGGAAAGLDITAVVYRRAGLAILLQHHAVDRRQDPALREIEPGVVDFGFGLLDRGVRDRGGVDRNVEIVLRLISPLEQRLRPRQFGIAESGVGDGQVVVRDRLFELCLVVGVVDLGEQVAFLDVLALFDRFVDDLAENLGADRDVLGARDHVAGAAEQFARLAGALDGHRSDLDLERTSQRVQPGFVAGARKDRDDHQRNDRGQRAASPPGLRAARDSQRLEVQNVWSALYLGHETRFSSAR